ncbi:MAG TPA: 50S ribosomal protein L11 methyltransferase [Pseudonocardiaceae bacterium]|nr:50S ribosomal protein L11 methyltransferase [Pseudonocardiaceae bacterium]
MTALDFVLANTRPVAVPLAPEITLRQTDDDPFALWERTGADVPYWAFAWAGGQALARYVLDNPACVAGRRVLDLASGSGLVAIAAALSGAAAVTATDIDPLAVLAIGLNAEANGVVVTALEADVLDRSGGGAEVVLAGDVCYDVDMAALVLPFLSRAAARGASVLVGDPGRDHFPATGFERLAAYSVPATGKLEGADTTSATVWRRWG